MKKKEEEIEMDLSGLKKRKKKEEVPIRPKQKNAVLIGLKHPQMKSDVKRQLLRMKDLLVKLRGFSETNITLMIEDEEEEEEEATYLRLQPTDDNIRIKLYSLVVCAKPGDILFIHLIAYGCSDGFIFTADREHLPDTYLRGIIEEAVMRGCNLTFVSDCVIDSLPKCPCPRRTISISLEDWDAIFELNKDSTEPPIPDYWCTDATKLTSVNILKEAEAEEKTHEGSSGGVILLIPFIPQENPGSHNVSELFCIPPSQHKSYGGFTNAVLDLIEETHGQLTILELAQKAMDRLGGEIPSLRCSNLNHARGAPFL